MQVKDQGIQHVWCEQKQWVFQKLVCKLEVDLCLFPSQQKKITIHKQLEPTKSFRLKMAFLQYLPNYSFYFSLKFQTMLPESRRKVTLNTILSTCLSDISSCVNYAFVSFVVNINFNKNSCLLS